MEKRSWIQENHKNVKIWFLATDSINFRFARQATEWAQNAVKKEWKGQKDLKKEVVPSDLHHIHMF